MSSPPAESIAEENVMAMPTYPPYPPYEPQPIPPTVADVILLGQDIRYAHKSGKPLKVKPSPRPARPKSIKATTEVRMTPRERLAHARCLRRYGVVLTDRLERISKPDRRKIIYMWRERQDTLPAEKIARLRSMLDADEPFKPEQAYDYFLNLRKSKKKPARGTRKDTKKDVMALWEDRRYEWARNAAVAFARGIQQRLARPGMYSLQDEMLRLSNIILQDICYFLKTRTPSRHYSHPKARLMVEIADKVAVWISDVLQESEDRMLMMDFDENDEVEQHVADFQRDEMDQKETPAPDQLATEDGKEKYPTKGSSLVTSPSVQGSTKTDNASPRDGASAQTSKKSSNIDALSKPASGTMSKPALEAISKPASGTISKVVSETAPKPASATISKVVSETTPKPASGTISKAASETASKPGEGSPTKTGTLSPKTNDRKDNSAPEKVKSMDKGGMLTENAKPSDECAKP